MNKQRMVDDFMRLAGQYKGLAAPGVPDPVSRMLRCTLILEELKEFCTASGFYMIDGEVVDAGGYLSDVYPAIKPSVPDLADAIADLLYVVYGAAVAWGIKIDPVFGAVHHANMTKFGPGSYAREDGKWIKPPGWVPPDLDSILVAQGWDD